MKFKGFSHETMQFFFELAMNNEKEWFDANRERYDKFVLEPSRMFVTSMGERIRTLSEGFYAIPKVNKSLFRINRDTRFSKNKTPYKTHLGITIWEGSLENRMECPGFYFHIEPESIFVGGGVYRFSKQFLESWRQKVSNPKQTARLNKLIENFQISEQYSLGGERYKRPPRGFEITPENEQLLKYKGLWTSYVFSKDDVDIIFKPEIIEFLFEKFERMYAIHQFLMEVYIDSV